jgi:threonine dehydratase
MSVTAQNIFQARERIRPFVRKTPLEYSPRLSRLANAEVFLKMENWQHSGSFKPRGSFNRLLKMSDAERAKGIVAPTAGNHGVGLSFAAKQLGVTANIFLPKTADTSKLKMLEDNGAKVTFFENTETARNNARQMAKAEGMTFLSAYNDASMIEGGGTIAVEILEDLPNVDLALVCVGGGGLIAGIGTMLKAVNPKIEVVGFQTENSPQMKRSFEAGKSVAIEHKTSIAEGISGEFELDNMTFPIIRKVVDRIETVSDEEIINAMRWMFENHQIIAEPSGVPCIAYLLRQPKEVAGRKIMLTISGRNVSSAKFLEFIEKSEGNN